MDRGRVSIGVKRSTKDFLNYISSKVQHKIGRGDLTWDDLLIYIALKYAYFEDIDFKEVFPNLKLSEEERKMLRDKLNINL
ncbi:MAG: hypothetical protein ACP5F1_00570 [Thermoplasmata archaeon]|nr:hypothetical protein [Thermoplasmata archaeon]